MTFKPGQSGNPGGRPPGSRNKTTVALDMLLDGEAEAITRKAIDMAKAGDGPALRLVMDRICPPRKDRPVTFDLPLIGSPKDAADASAALLKAVSAGDITPLEAQDVSRLLDSYVKAFEVAEIDARLAALEQANGESKA